MQDVQPEQEAATQETKEINLSLWFFLSFANFLSLEQHRRLNSLRTDRLFSWKKYFLNLHTQQSPEPGVQGPIRCLATL